MPILLDAPHKGYSEVKIVEIRLRIQRRSLFLLFQHGDTVAGAWVAGDLVPAERLIRNAEQVLDGKGGVIREADPVYDLLIVSSKAAAADEAVEADGGFNCYVGTARNLYQYALDAGWYEGTIA